MTYQARQRVEALREVLLGAARDGFTQVAEQSAEGARHTAQISEELVALSSQLEQMVTRFKL